MRKNENYAEQYSKEFLAATGDYADAFDQITDPHGDSGTNDISDGEDDAFFRARESHFLQSTPAARVINKRRAANSEELRSTDPPSFFSAEWNNRESCRNEKLKPTEAKTGTADLHSNAPSNTFGSIIGDIVEHDPAKNCDSLDFFRQITTGQQKEMSESSSISILPSEDAISEDLIQLGNSDWSEMERKLGPEKLLQLRRDIESKLSPTILSAFRKIAEKRKTSASKSLNSNEATVSASKQAGLCFQTSVDELKKLRWTEEVNPALEDGDIPDDRISELRFHFNGTLLGPWINENYNHGQTDCVAIDDTVEPLGIKALKDPYDLMGLRHHGMYADQPGYTINEALIFIRARDFPPQQLVGLHILRNIFSQRALTRYQLNKVGHKNHNSDGMASAIERPVAGAGYGFGLHRFDDYLFTGLTVHEKLSYLLTSEAGSTRPVVASVILALSALFAPDYHARGASPVDQLQDLSHLTASDAQSFIEVPIDWLQSRRGLLRTEEIQDLVEGRIQSTDFSKPLFAAVAISALAQSSDEPSTDNPPMFHPDSEFQQRRNDPMLSLLLWQDGNDSILRRIVKLLDLKDTSETVVCAILALLQALASHSAFVCRHIATITAQDLTLHRLAHNRSVGSSNGDEIDRLLLQLLTLFQQTLGLGPIRIINETEEHNHSYNNNNDATNVTWSQIGGRSVAAICWRHVGKWLKGTSVIVTPVVQEALKWTPQLEDGTIDSGAPLTSLASSWEFQQILSKLFGSDSDIATSVILWTLLCKVALIQLHKDSIPGLSFASLILRHSDRALDSLFKSVAQSSVDKTLAVSIVIALKSTFLLIHQSSQATVAGNIADETAISNFHSQLYEAIGAVRYPDNDEDARQRRQTTVELGLRPILVTFQEIAKAIAEDMPTDAADPLDDESASTWRFVHISPVIWSSSKKALLGLYSSLLNAVYLVHPTALNCADKLTTRHLTSPPINSRTIAAHDSSHFHLTSPFLDSLALLATNLLAQESGSKVKPARFSIPLRDCCRLSTLRQILTCMATQHHVSSSLEIFLNEDFLHLMLRLSCVGAQYTLSSEDDGEQDEYLDLLLNDNCISGYLSTSPYEFLWAIKIPLALALTILPNEAAELNGNLPERDTALIIQWMDQLIEQLDTTNESDRPIFLLDVLDCLGTPFLDIPNEIARRFETLTVALSRLIDPLTADYLPITGDVGFTECNETLYKSIQTSTPPIVKRLLDSIGPVRTDLLQKKIIPNLLRAIERDSGLSESRVAWLWLFLMSPEMNVGHYLNEALFLVTVKALTLDKIQSDCRLFGISLGNYVHINRDISVSSSVCPDDIARSIADLLVRT